MFQKMVTSIGEPNGIHTIQYVHKHGFLQSLLAPYALTAMQATSRFTNT